MARTTNDLPGTKCIADVYVRLRNLAEDEHNLYNLFIHLYRNLSLTRHDIEQRGGERIEKPFSDEHPAEVVLGGWTLQVEHAAYAVQGMDH